MSPRITRSSATKASNGFTKSEEIVKPKPKSAPKKAASAAIPANSKAKKAKLELAIEAIDPEPETKSTAKKASTKAVKKTEGEDTVPITKAKKAKLEPVVEAVDPEPETKSTAKKASTKDVKKTKVEEDITAETIHDFTVNDIKGKAVSLDKYKGHVCIIVNVASKCGYTKNNYQQLVELHEKYGDEKGLKILAFPCNQFGKQEPGDAGAICKFVEKYNVTFDLFEKINVNGPTAHPLYTFLNGILPDPNLKGKGDKIKWNFTKFIIDEDGKPVERFGSAIKPLTMVNALQKYW